MWENEKDPVIILGGNTFIQCGSIITYDGKQFFNILHRDSDNRLGIDLDVYDQDGKKIATIKHSNVVDGDSNRFDIHYSTDVMTLTDKETDEVLVRIEKKPFEIETKFKPQQMFDELTLIAAPPPLNINEIEGILEVTLRTYLPESGFLLIATPNEINLLEPEVSEDDILDCDFFRNDMHGMVIEKYPFCGEMLKSNLKNICPACNMDLTKYIPSITGRIISKVKPFLHAFQLYTIYWLTTFIVIKSAFSYTLFYEDAKEYLESGIISIISDYGWADHYIWFLIIGCIVSFISAFLCGATTK